VTDKPETLEQSASDGRQDAHVALTPAAKRKKPRQASTVPGISDDEVRRKIIQASIAQYPGACPCPYIRDGGGRRCGGRSAYSRPGGYDPLCYPADVTPEMIAQYRVSAH